MPLDFPASPTLGQTYTVSGSPYTWVCVQTTPVVIWDVQGSASPTVDSTVTALLFGGM